MSWFGDLCDGVREIGQKVCEACSSAVEAIGSVVEKVKPFISEISKLALDVLAPVVQIAVSVGNILGLFKTGNPEKLGDKVLQGQEAGVTLDSCGNSFEEYKRKIDDFEIDPEKTAQTSKYDKLIAAGTFSEASLQDEYGFGLGSLVPFMVKHPEFCAPDRVAGWIKACNEIGMSTDQIASYFRGETWGNEETNIEEKIFVATESQTGTETTPAQIKDEYRAKTAPEERLEQNAS